ncbi:hypothetical protein M0Q97_01705 [Candidatus Dojkabacteria bacterium]|nr:hypothetical protein [Candidatus Dojkabacteria bacterium]
MTIYKSGYIDGAINACEIILFGKKFFLKKDTIVIYKIGYIDGSQNVLKNRTYDKELWKIDSVVMNNKLNEKL